MKIVAMDDICFGINELRKLCAARERPFVTTIPPVGEAGWIGEAVEASCEPSHAGQGAFMGACAIRKPLPWKACPMRFAWNFHDIRVFGIFAADDELGVVSKVAESAEEIPGGAFGTAAAVCGIDLNYF